MKLFKLFAVLQLLPVAACAVHRRWDPTVHVKNGSYEGLYSPEYHQDFFLGMPYAQPPVGDLRFRQAQSLNETWQATKTAKEYSTECYGYGTDQSPCPISEDCLTINVIRPAGYEHEKLPVGLWIHGGGFTEGGNRDQRYNMSFTVENSVKIGKPIIAAAINYRLSAWGFLYSDEVMGQGLANIGLRDQRLALHWVQENIAAFGGDPRKVTIWGESAGAASVGFHLTAYGGRDDGLFRGAIAESGGPISYAPQRGTSAYQDAFNNLTKQAGCEDSFDKIQCLREIPAKKLNNIINAGFAGSFGPVLDGDFSQIHGSIQVKHGDFVRVPLMIGTNSDEGASFGPPGIYTKQDFRDTLDYETALPEAFKKELEKAYPDDPDTWVLQSLGNTRLGPPYGKEFRRAATYVGDVVFIASRREAVESWARYGVPSYSYRFNAIPREESMLHMVGHFLEVVYVFHNWIGTGYDLLAPFLGTPPETSTFIGLPKRHYELSQLMSSSWISFIHDQDPNGYKSRPKNVPQWPEYSLDKPENIVFDANVTSHLESDTWRSKGIQLIIDNQAGLYLE